MAWSIRSEPVTSSTLYFMQDGKASQGVGDNTKTSNSSIFSNWLLRASSLQLKNNKLLN